MTAMLDQAHPHELRGAEERFLIDDQTIDVWAVISSIETALSDPAYAANRAAGQARLNDHFDRVRDEALIRLGLIDAPVEGL